MKTNYEDASDEFMILDDEFDGDPEDYLLDNLINKREQYED